MLDLATAAIAAAMLNNSLSAVDKVYNWWNARRGGAPAGELLRDSPTTQVLQYQVTEQVGAPGRWLIPLSQVGLNVVC